ncbi:hypothetical protein Tco_0910477 [Tanacetum coccineum]|uniref:Uncharacterized protein n=1 Tax=Tanacetum coccineum TaxID=301880 RepID=A0ABQ5CUQ4_9ASTR
MNPIAAQQVALDNALVAPEKHVQIGSVQDFQIKSLMNFLQMKKLSLSSKNLGTKVTSNLSLMWLLINCTNHGELLLQSSTSVYHGKSLVLIRSDSQEHKYYKKKAPAKTERSKGIELLSDAALLEEAQLKKDIKRRKRETHIHQACGSSKGADLESEGDSDDEDDEFVHTPEDYIPTDDEDVDDEVFDRINKEMYSDVNVELKDSECEGEGKDDKDMTHDGQVDAEHEEVSQEITCEMEIISMMDVKVQHEDPNQVFFEQARKQQEPKYIIVSSNVDALWEFDQKQALFETMTKTKSFEQNFKHKALYHALMESILEDEDAMDKGKETEPSKKAKSTGTSKGTTKSQPKSTGESAQAEETVFEAGDTQVPHDLKEDMGNTDEPPVVNVDPKDWFKKSKRPPTPDPVWNEGKSVEDKPTQKWICDLVKAEKPSKTFDDLMSTPIDFSAFVMNRQ